MKTPLVSIIIPTYNRAHLIKETLDSVLAQIYQNWECIVVDDGSTDNTEEVMREYVATDARFQYHHRPKDRLPGGNAARNFGFEMSSGDCIIFLDSDDILHNQCLGNRVMRFQEYPQCSFLIFNMGIYDDRRFVEHTATPTTDKRDALKAFLSQHYPWTITGPIWKRTFLDNGLNFDERLLRYQDVDFHIKALFSPGVNYKTIPITDCYYRKNKQSQKKYAKADFKKDAVQSYYYLLCNLMDAAPPSEVKAIEGELKYGFYKVISKFADLGNQNTIAKIYSLLDRGLHFSGQEKLYYGMLRMLAVYYKNKKGYYVLRKPIANYFENPLQSSSQ